jgi:2-iminoacetate synthase
MGVQSPAVGVDRMEDFRVNARAVQEQLHGARRLAGTDLVDSLLDRGQRGDSLTPADIAVLWFASRIDTETLFHIACTVAAGRHDRLETFSPLYMTNTCDAECRMCGMRRDNDALRRETADIAEVSEQLRVLQRRGMRAVALLTGEYHAAKRPWALAYVNEALRVTQALQFNHVLINVGSIDESEFDTLLAGIARHSDGSVRPKLTMCTFQETYDRCSYSKFMGTDAENPRADFDRRLTNFDRAFRAGMRVANPGILVGLNPDLAFEMTALALHAQHLLARGMEVYLSVPRLRQIAGSRNQRGASDAEFIRLVSLLSFGLPACKIVITTREDAAMQQKLAPIVTVISAGSAAVAPYTTTGARFPLDTSQFEVIDQRPFEEILNEHGATSRAIENFQPPAA